MTRLRLQLISLRTNFSSSVLLTHLWQHSLFGSILGRIITLTGSCPGQLRDLFQIVLTTHNVLEMLLSFFFAFSFFICEHIKNGAFEKQGVQAIGKGEGQG